MKFKAHTANTVHIAGRGSVVRQLRILASQFRVLRTGNRTLPAPETCTEPLNVMLKHITGRYTAN